jgi:hypothetical protein
VLFVEASDTLRILGKYPEAEELPVNGSSKTKDGRGQVAVTFRPRKARYTILAMSPLPLGTEAHRTDTYNLIAMLTPAKLVIVGLKPTPKTWYKQARVYEKASERHAKGHGCLAWWPSTSSKEASAPATSPVSSSEPLLAYSWGSIIHLVRVSETLVKQSRTNARTGKTIQVDVGLISVQSLSKCNAQAEVLALQWLNANVGSFSLLFDFVSMTYLRIGLINSKLSLLHQALCWCIMYRSLNLSNVRLLIVPLSCLPFGSESPARRSETRMLRVILLIASAFTKGGYSPL